MRYIVAVQSGAIAATLFLNETRVLWKNAARDSGGAVTKMTAQR
jgi:hypothetical protein